MTTAAWHLSLVALRFVVMIGGSILVAEIVRLRHDLDDHLAQGRPAPGRHRGDQ